MYKAVFALSATIILWASAFVGIRYTLSVFSPGALALYRFAIASLVLLSLYPLFSKKGAMCVADKCKLLAIGVAGIGIYNLSLNYGEVTVSAGMASFLIGQMPIMTIILSFVILKESISLQMLPGLGLSLLGIAMIGFADDGDSSWDIGIALILLAALMGALYTLSQRVFLKKYHPVLITAWVIWGGTAALSFFAKDLYNQWPHASLKIHATVIYMGIFPAALAYIGWCYVLRHIQATHATLFLYTLPLVSTALGYFLIGETPSTLSFCGGLIALCGAFLSSKVHVQSRK